MVSATGLLVGLWRTLDEHLVVGSAFEPRSDRLPPRPVRDHLFPTWTSGREAADFTPELRRALKRAAGEIDEREADLARVWFDAMRERIHRDCVWHRTFVDQYRALHKAVRAGDRTVRVPHYPDSTAEMFKIVRDFDGGPFDPRDDPARTAEFVRQEFAARTGFNPHTTNAAALRAELARNQVRYQLDLDEAWTSPRINQRATRSAEVDRLLDQVAAGLTHSVRGKFRGVVADGEAGDLAREAWSRLLALAPAIDTYVTSDQLWLTASGAVAKPQLDARGRRGDDRAPRLDQPVIGRIATLLRPTALPARADDALARAVLSTAQPLGLAATASRVALLIAYRCRIGVELVFGDAELGPAELAIRTAWRRSGAVALAQREDSRAERLMSTLFSGAPPCRNWLGRVWGRLWRDELIDNAVHTLDDAWDHIVKAANSAGTELRKEVHARETDGHDDAWESSELTVLPRAERAVATVIEAWDDVEARLELGSNIRDYSFDEARAVIRGLEKPEPVTLERDRTLWAAAVEAYAADGDEPELLEWATLATLVTILVRIPKAADE